MAPTQVSAIHVNPISLAKEGTMSGYPKIVHTEEGMREGLQIESANIPVDAKIRLLDALSETGLKEIAVGSFVSPKYTPQMAVMEELVTRFTPKPGVRYVYTALNDKGRERAAAYTPPLSRKVLEYATRVDMCDVFAQRNTAGGGLAQDHRNRARQGRHRRLHVDQQCLRLQLER
jgi:hypothetical protein